MKGTATGWESDFPGANGICKAIAVNDGQVTVTAYKTRTGDHAAMYMEYNVGGMAFTRKVHLVMGQTAGSIDILEEPPAVNDHVARESDDYVFTCYDMNDSQRTNLEAAIRKFKTKNDAGRYSYRLAGGLLGRLTTKPGKRGVNCADFVVKVLADAKIAKLSEMPISTPKSVAKRKGSVFVDLA